MTQCFLFKNSGFKLCFFILSKMFINSKWKYENNKTQYGYALDLCINKQDNYFKIIYATKLSNEKIFNIHKQYHNNEPICQLVEGRNGMLTLLEDAAGGGLGKATDLHLLEALDNRNVQLSHNVFHTP